MAEIGETLVAAWYRYVDGLDLVVEGVRLRDQGELDVLAIGGGRAVAAEVATHILGLDYGGYTKTATKIADKVLRARSFLEETFPEHEQLVAFWTPRVPSGLSALINAIEGLEIVANDEYARRIQQLIDRARVDPSATTNDAYRLLQVLTHVRGDLVLRVSSNSRTLRAS